jgi:hypothetical protein
MVSAGLGSIAFPAALRIDAYSQASCTIRSLHATLPTGLALPGMKKWDFFGRSPHRPNRPLQGVKVIEATHHLGRTTALPLSHLAAGKVDRSTAEAIGD